MPGTPAPESEAKASPNERVIERLCAFLDTLPERISLSLLNALDRMDAIGEPFPMADVMKARLRRNVDIEKRSRARFAMPSRLFFRPIDPFLVDEVCATRIQGRISRKSLAPLWTWMKQDVLPEAVASYEEATREVLFGDDERLVQNIAQGFRREAAAHIRQILDLAQEEKAERKLVARIGGHAVLEDTKQILFVFDHEDILRSLDKRIIGPIRNVDDHQLGLMVAAFVGLVREHPAIVGHGAALVMAKMAQPWQMLRVVTQALETDSPARISDSPWAPIVELMLFELDRLALRVENAAKANRLKQVSRSIRDFAGYARAIGADLDLSDHRWGKRLGPPRVKMSEVLAAVFEPLPGQVRRLLRRGKANDTTVERFDAIEAQDAEAAIEILGIVRPHAGELALNEPCRRAQAEIEASLETMVTILAEAVRTTGGVHRDAAIDKLDFAMRISPAFLGKPYAEQLARQIEVATGGAWKTQKAA